ncbi:iron uptake porin [Mastigocladopsis repens]|uniref:iron uptake porin n=1 Tax=Mastigocladopsis repens TaxID=221287 RepID=UPI0003120950|nr:iron uptake porin [Mastigocladopsis repens]
MKKQSWSKVVWNFCQLNFLALTITLSLADGTFGNQAPVSTANQQFPSSRASIDQDIHLTAPLAKITSVSELAEVQPNDWAFQALKSLVERYDVVAGYSDSTFGGNRAMTRYEFAARLTATMNRISELMIAHTSNRVSQQDLETLQRLQTEFAHELKVVLKKLDSLEARLPRQPFSTTTKLQGEVLFALAGVGSGDKADGSGDATDSHLTFSNRVRLNFNTSFTGKDILRTRLQARNISGIDHATGTDMARLAFQGNSNSDFNLTSLEYRFPIGEQAVVYLEAVGGSLNDFTNTLNPFFTGSGRGSISRFAQRNPIYRQGGEMGVGLDYEFSETVSLSLGYLAENINDPEVGFDKAGYAAIAQLTLEPSDTFKVGFTYIHSYNSLDTGTGSRGANDPFNDESDAVTADSFGLQSAIAINSKLALSGWLGFTHAKATDLPNNPVANILNWALTLAFLDLGREGNVAGIAIGQPPKVINNEFKVAGQPYEDEDTALHLEAFYRFQVDDHLAITPGVLVIASPEHNHNTSTIYVGTIRTTFRF